jgi:hypothetical protein
LLPRYYRNIYKRWIPVFGRNHFLPFRRELGAADILSKLKVPDNINGRKVNKIFPAALKPILSKCKFDGRIMISAGKQELCRLAD